MKLNVNLDILKKYSRPGPRYTSYPTAPHFTPEFGPEDFERAIRESNRTAENGDISLYFHFPFCPQLCFYCGCNVIISRNETRINRYLEYLKKEIQLLRRLIHPDRKVTQMHWGGGTPNYLQPQQIRTIFQAIRDAFPFTEDAEISVEIDPRTLTPEHLPLFRELGFNRLSFGVQDFEHQVQVTINRLQPEDMTRRVVAESRALGFPSINVDLIYGLPYQTEATFQRTIDKIIDIAPDRLAVFNYAHVPWLKKHQRVIPEEALPTPEVKLRLFKMTIEQLTEAGYVFIGMDHFARPDDELSIAQKTRTLYRNFQGYSPRAGAEVFALGITSISQLQRIYAQNVKDTRRYEQLLDAGKIVGVEGSVRLGVVAQAVALVVRPQRLLGGLDRARHLEPQALLEQLLARVADQPSGEGAAPRLRVSKGLLDPLRGHAALLEKLPDLALDFLEHFGLLGHRVQLAGRLPEQRLTDQLLRDLGLELEAVVGPRRAGQLAVELQPLVARQRRPIRLHELLKGLLQPLGGDGFAVDDDRDL